MKRILTQASVLILLLLSQASFATQNLFFNVSASGPTLKISTTIANHNYPSAGIMLKTKGYRVTNPGVDCIPNSNGYCLFSANNTSARTIAITGAPGTLNFVLCLNGQGALSCQKYHVTLTPPPPPSSHAAYITNGDNIVSLCPINNNGSFGLCVDAGIATTFITPRGIALNNARTLAYIVNNGDDILHLCTINPVTGIFDECINANQGEIPTGFDGPDGLALNGTNSFIYISNVGTQRLSVCSFNLDGSLNACNDAGFAFNEPRGIAINNANTFAYVVNYGAGALGVPTVSRCVIDLVGGSFSECVDSGNSGVNFSGPFGIALNPAGTFAYVTNNGNDTVSVCPILPTAAAAGRFGACVPSGNSDPSGHTGVPINGPFGISINAAGTHAYVANAGTNTVLVCPILPVSGLFGACVDSGRSGLPFGTPVFMALK